MSTVISIVSFRRGTGRSSLTANLGALLASQGRRVGLIDTDFSAPSLHMFFGMAEHNIPHTLNDYLWDRCSLQQAIQHVPRPSGSNTSGDLILLPASSEGTEILKTLRQTYNLDKLYEAIQQMNDTYQLDFILLDTPAGLSRDTLHTMALSNMMLVVLHPDQQDFQGTSVLVEVGRNLGTTRLLLVLNESPASLDPIQARQELERSYRCPAAEPLPHSEELMELASSRPVVYQSPDCAYVAVLRQLAAQISS